MTELYDYETQGYFDFHGSEDPYFGLDGAVWIAPEDECDGWRSVLGHVHRVDPQKLPNMPLNLKTVLSRVRVQSYNAEDESGWKLVDINNRIWLRFGTSNYHGYYPYYFYQEY